MTINYPSFNNQIASWYKKKNDLKPGNTPERYMKHVGVNPNVPDEIESAIFEKYNLMKRNLLLGTGNTFSINKWEKNHAVNEINQIAETLGPDIERLRKTLDLDLDGKLSTMELGYLVQAIRSAKTLDETIGRLTGIKHGRLDMLVNTGIYMKRTTPHAIKTRDLLTYCKKKSLPGTTIENLISKNWISKLGHKWMIVNINNIPKKQLSAQDKQLKQMIIKLLGWKPDKMDRLEYEDTLRDVFPVVLGLNKTLEENFLNFKVRYGLLASCESVYHEEFFEVLNRLMLNLYKTPEIRRKENYQQNMQEKKLSFAHQLILKTMRRIKGAFNLKTLNMQLALKLAPLEINDLTLLAQTIKESGKSIDDKDGLEIKAISNKGAIGIRQMMPSSFYIVATTSQIPEEVLGKKEEQTLVILRNMPKYKPMQSIEQVKKIRTKTFPFIIQLNNYSELIVESKKDLLEIQDSKIDTKFIQEYGSKRIKQKTSLYNKLHQAEFNALASICFLIKEKRGSMSAYFGTGDTAIRYTNDIALILSRFPGITTVPYTVLPGDSLYSISDKLPTTMDAIRTANPDIANKKVIQKYEVLSIPIIFDANTHYVKTGETLGSILEQYFSTKKEVIVATELLIESRTNGSKITPGDKLIIPDADRVAKKLIRIEENKIKKDKKRFHLIKKGETLSSIADSHKIKLIDLLEANKLKTNSIIKPGKYLKLPEDTIKRSMKKRSLHKLETPRTASETNFIPEKKRKVSNIKKKIAKPASSSPEKMLSITLNELLASNKIKHTTFYSFANFVQKNYLKNATYDEVARHIKKNNPWIKDISKMPSDRTIQVPL